MKFSTFYKIYYQHRIDKANFFLRLYIFFIIPFKYFYNLFFFPPKKNLDLIEIESQSLNNLKLSELFDYFNSDKGDSFEDHICNHKRKKKKIGHGYAQFYEKYFESFKNLPINILEIGSFHGNASAGLFLFQKSKNLWW